MNIYVHFLVTVAQTRIHEAALRLFAEKGVTQLTVSELAEAAGVARGTVYNHCSSVEALFEEVAAGLAAEMQDRILALNRTLEDPAEGLANGIRLFVKRAHEEPHWGRFISRFAVSEPTLQLVIDGPLIENLERGIAKGRYELTREQVPSAAGLLSGGLLAAMLLVLEGHLTFRKAGEEMAELGLRAIGLSQQEAHALSSAPLASLPPGPTPPALS